MSPNLVVLCCILFATFAKIDAQPACGRIEIAVYEMIPIVNIFHMAPRICGIEFHFLQERGIEECATGEECSALLQEKTAFLVRGLKKIDSIPTKLGQEFVATAKTLEQVRAIKLDMDQEKPANLSKIDLAKHWGHGTFDMLAHNSAHFTHAFINKMVEADRQLDKHDMPKMFIRQMYLLEEARSIRGKYAQWAKWLGALGVHVLPARNPAVVGANESPSPKMAPTEGHPKMPNEAKMPTLGAKMATFGEQAKRAHTGMSQVEAERFERRMATLNRHLTMAKL